MIKKEIKAKEAIAIQTLKTMKLEKLIDLWEELDKKDDETPEYYRVRGWVMDALELKDADAFDKWIDSLEDSPRNFYIKKSAPLSHK